MCIYTIRKLLQIPEYKVTRIISISETEIHIRIEAYKRKTANVLAAARNIKNQPIV